MPPLAAHVVLDEIGRVALPWEAPTLKLARTHPVLSVVRSSVRKYQRHGLRPRSLDNIIKHECL